MWPHNSPIRHQNNYREFNLDLILPTALMWGDPHMKSMDGHTFTFNGLGDYTMVQLQNNPSGFNLQARLSKAVVNGTGEAPKATVFSGFCVKDGEGAQVEIYMNVTSKLCSCGVLLLWLLCKKLLHEVN